MILLVACGIFRGCGFKECAVILENGVFFCSRSKQHLGQQQSIYFDYHTSGSSVPLGGRRCENWNTHTHTGLSVEQLRW